VAVPTLALHLGALGDFVLSWPALGLLAAHGEPHLWGRADWGRLVLPPERVFDREAARFASLFASQLDGRLAGWLGGFERVVVFAADPPQELLANLAGAAPQLWTVRTRPAPGEIAHAGDMQLAQLRRLGLDGPAPPLLPRLPASPSPAGAVLAPGSGGKAKRLNPGLAQNLARRMAAEHGPVTLLLGPAEDEAYRRELARALADAPHRVVDSPPVERLAALLAGSALYVGADSGVTHLAAALGAPALAVFQASDPRVWAPRGPRARVLGVVEAPHAALTPPGADPC
jgi:hypothetical protein